MLTRNDAKSRAFLIAAIAVLFLFTFSSHGFADVAELNLVKQAIRGKRAQWTAGETTISKLPLEHKKRRVGLFKPSVDEVQSSLESQALSAPLSLAAPYGTFDWRNYNGANYVTAVRDQGNCGSCWAFATAAALEAQVAMGSSGANQDLAEQTLVSCSGAGSCSGGYIDRASNYIKSTGLPMESCFPYTAANTSCGYACAGGQNNSDRITAWHWVATTAPTVDLLKNALYTYGPLVSTMNVYGDFFYYTSGIYSYSYGSYQGGHAILIVGYDDSSQCFIVKNSWGNGWGESGYFRIAYSQLTTAVKFGFYTIAYEGYQPGQSPTPPVAPGALTATAASSSQIILSWTDNSNNEDGFKIERCQGSGCTTFSQIATVGTGVKTYSNSGLAVGTTYTYRVRAYNSTGDSGYSNVTSAATPAPPQPPAAPTGLRIMAAFP